MELVTSWMEKGLEQGRQEGELALIMRQLARRVGEIGPEIQARVQQLALPQLEELGEALLDFTDAKDLENWLQQNEK